MTLVSSRPARLGLLALATVLLAALLLPSGDADARRFARAGIEDPDGDRIGTVTFIERRGTVEVRAEVSGVEPGFHGFHIHQNGTCEPTFAAAGGHWNPDGTAHGEHAGDLPSLYVMEDGTAELAFRTDAFTVDELLEGHAVIVHGGRDNFANIPERYLSTTEGVNGPDSETLAAGDAGPRVGCGVIGVR